MRTIIERLLWYSIFSNPNPDSRGDYFQAVDTSLRRSMREYRNLDSDYRPTSPRLALVLPSKYSTPTLLKPWCFFGSDILTRT